MDAFNLSFCYRVLNMEVLCLSFRVRVARRRQIHFEFLVPIRVDGACAKFSLKFHKTMGGMFVSPSSGSAVYALP